jgi:DNA-directed RNA polymerase subunit RPC12/RpoP
MCPKCSSIYLKIRKQTGVERMLVFLTGKRKYLCADCGNAFRALDRRRNSRADQPDRSDLLASETVSRAR